MHLFHILQAYKVIYCHNLLKICLGECDVSWLGQTLSWLLPDWLDREHLVQFFDDADLPSDPIFKIVVIWAPNHVNSPERGVFFHGIVNFISVAVKP